MECAKEHSAAVAVVETVGDQVEAVDGEKVMEGDSDGAITMISELQNIEVNNLPSVSLVRVGWLVGAGT